MHTRSIAIALAAALAAAMPASAQTAPAAPAIPGAPDVSRVTAGTYNVEPNHTQVIWSLDHLGFTVLSGMFGSPSGSMTLDPAHPEKAQVNVTFEIGKVALTSAAFVTHFLSEEIMDAAKYPTATFRSTSVVVSGQTAKITGDLTLHGVTKPVVLDAKFYGAGANPMGKKPTIGFSATTSINRSDFGIGYAVPRVSDKVDLKIAANFERAAD